MALTELQKLGMRGERLAVRYLRGIGFDVIEVNVKTESAQLDILARDGADFVAVEVKTHTESARERATAEGYSREQRERQQKALRELSRKFKMPEFRFRADLIEIAVSPFFPVSIKHQTACLNRKG